MTRLLTCPQEKNSIPKIISSTPISTNAIKSATKPWIWTSNTIDTGDFGSPTRHRRETEDTVSTAGEFPITKETSTSTPAEIKTTKKQMETLKIETTTIKPQLTTRIQTEKPTTMKVTNKEETTTPQATTEMEESEYPSINQGQLFSFIANGTIFDIIEVNDTASDLSKDKNTKIIDETTTKVTLTSNVNLKKEITKAEKSKGTETPITTISYIKEAPPTKTSELTSVKQPTDETKIDTKKTTKQPTTKQPETTAQQPILTTMKTKINKNLTNEQDKTFIKEIENSSGNLVKLNRTSRKELPMIDFNFTSEEKNEISEEKNISKEEEHDHKVVEITLMHDDKKKEGTKLYITTKKHDKLKMRKSEKLIDGKPKNLIANEKIKPKIKEDVKIPSEVHEMLNHTTEANLKVIDPKLVDLNFNTTNTHIHSERIPIKLQEAPEKLQKNDMQTQKTNTPIPTEQIKDNTEFESSDFDDTSDMNDLKTTEEPLEPIPEAQPRPNRNRVLTRPQRRSFYPYFFSRVLG